ncbi:hypothetical protein ASF73_17175 [Xanthomonas sp. Leaf131]|nr:hypothetical protein ASF73_17175 [Xanthomonas sp. Leaf131]
MSFAFRHGVHAVGSICGAGIGIGVRNCNCNCNCNRNRIGIQQSPGDARTYCTYCTYCVYRA